MNQETPERATELQLQAPEGETSKEKENGSNNADQALAAIDHNGSSSNTAPSITHPTEPSRDCPREVITLDESQETSKPHLPTPLAPPAATPPQPKPSMSRAILNRILSFGTSHPHTEPQANGTQPGGSVTDASLAKVSGEIFKSTSHKKQQIRKPSSQSREIQESPDPPKQLHDEASGAEADDRAPKLQKSRNTPQGSRSTASPKSDEQGGPGNAIVLDLDEDVDLLVHVEPAGRETTKIHHQNYDDEEMLLPNSVEGSGGPDDPLELSDSSPTTLKRSKRKSTPAASQPLYTNSVNTQRDNGTRHPSSATNKDLNRKFPDKSASIPSKRKITVTIDEDKESHPRKKRFDDPLHEAVAGKSASSATTRKFHD